MQRAKMAAPELPGQSIAGVARFDRHRHAARTQPAGGLNQNVSLEYEALTDDIGQLADRARVVTLAALRVGNSVTGGPGDTPVAELVGQAAMDRLLGAFF